MKERSVSQSRLMLLSPLADSRSNCKSPMGSEINTKSGSNTPRNLPPIDDLQKYFKMLEDQEEQALVAILKEIDDQAHEIFNKANSNE